MAELLINLHLTIFTNLFDVIVGLRYISLQ